MSADLSTFVINFIDECNTKGFSKASDIIKEARKEISKIEKEIKEIERKKEKIKFYYAVINQMGESSLNKRKTVEKISSMMNDSSEDAIELRKKICRLIEKSENGLTNRQIIKEIGGYKEDAKIYRAIKFLGEREIIKRNNSTENKLIPGNNWSSKESLIETNS